jgi:predicted cupin superfamily sugar epimerase
MSEALTAEDVIRQHALKPHPEGGWFRETFRVATGAHGRARIRPRSCSC